MWDPDRFGGIRYIVMPQTLIWTPKMFIYNSVDTKDMLTESRYDLRVSHDGQVKANIPIYVTCTCILYIEVDLGSPIQPYSNAAYFSSSLSTPNSAPLPRLSTAELE